MSGNKIKPKKSLGQNFLNSKGVIAKIAEAGNIFPGDLILEIGPGKGVLTENLLNAGAQVVAIEKDNRLIEYLEEKFSKFIKNKMLIIKNEDVLKFDPNYLDGNYKIIANIPYYITGEILEKFLSAEHQPNKMVLLIQKEVAERILARDKKESILSLSIKAYATPRIVMKVSRKSFVPAPKVDSAVIAIEEISKEKFGTIGETEFFKFIKTGFKHKRKVLIQNLTSLVQKEKLINAFLALNLDIKIRAEDLDFIQWIMLIDFLNLNK